VNSIPWLEHGFKVVGSNTNAGAAIHEIREKKPDVVFSDLRMPGYNGLELIEQLKGSGVDAEYIMLSAFDEYDAVRNFFLLGGVDYLLKPLDQDNAAIVLEKLSRKLASKNDLTPTVAFVPSQSSGFDDLVKYVAANFNKKHNLVDLSERFSLNQTYICDLFSKQYGSTLIVFVTNLRMKEASRLILETDTPLKEVAVFCGYSNYHQFAKVFKLHFGIAPSQFRGRLQPTPAATAGRDQ
jgi:YesN/AraC family two-component response regulator